MTQYLNKLYNKLNNNNFVVIALIFLTYCLSRIFLLYKYGEVAFGYDTGIYRHYINGYWQGGVSQPFSFSVYSNFLKFLGFSTETIMYVVYFLLAILMFWLVYLVAKTYFGQKSALWTLLIFTFSFTQFEFYWWYYYRSFLSIILLLIYLLINKKHSYWSLPFLTLAFCLHPLTALPFILGLMIMGIWQKTERMNYFLQVSVVLLVAGIFNFKEFLGYGNFVSGNNFVADKNSWQATSGQFITIWEYLKYSILYLPLSLIGFWKSRKENKYLFFTCLIAILFFISHFIFYRRMLILVDLFFVVFAGYILDFYWEKTKAWQKYLTTGLLIILISLNFYLVINKKPLINKIEFLNMQDSCFPTNDYLIISPSAKYAPWLYGFAKAPILAPGMLDNNFWTYNEWLNFWTTNNPGERKILRAKIPYEKVCVFVGWSDMYLEDKFLADKNFVKLNQYWWVYQ